LVLLPPVACRLFESWSLFGIRELRFEICVACAGCRNEI
jgi:hypothetical protein